MKQTVAAFAAGLIFGLGLTISAMINPSKVIAFLDIAGAWDASLMLVMASALLTAAIGFRLALQRQAPLFAASFQLPNRQDIDARLIGGSALFGIGWGLTGLCPGPALAALAFAGREILIFFAAMIAGILLFRLLRLSAAAPVPSVDG